MSEKKVYKKWIKKGNNIFLPTETPKILSELESGYYDIRFSDNLGFYFWKKEILLDDIFEFPSAIHKNVLEGIKTFWKRKEKFKEYGLSFKRGILLHGTAGTGKTCIVNLVGKYFINDLNGVILSLNNNGDLDKYSSAVPEILRIIEPNRPILVIIEDIENLCNYKDSESLLLNVLDGIDQLENVTYLATTNYIENLKARIINRPSRFDRRIFVPLPSSEDREYYFRKKLKENDIQSINLNKWIKDTEKMSIAHLSELIKSVVILDCDYDETIDILKEMNDIEKLHSNNYDKDTKNSIGFKVTSPQILEKQPCVSH